MSGLLSTLISSSTYTIISQLFNKKKERNTIIDPISCIIKLSLLNYYPDSTKISIHDNAIIFDEPGFLQGTYRKIYGDGRDDLHNLHNPISKAIQWYSKVENISDLFILTIDGLNKLKKNYPDRSIVSDALSSYVKLIQRGIINKSSKYTQMYENLTDVEKNYISSLDASVIGINNKSNESRNSGENNNKIIDINSEKKSKNIVVANTKKVENEIHDFIKNLWSDSEIIIIIKLMNELKKSNDKRNLLSTINTLVKTKEDRLHTFIEEHTSIL